MMDNWNIGSYLEETNEAVWMLIFKFYAILTFCSAILLLLLDLANWYSSRNSKHQSSPPSAREPALKVPQI
jgi:hypothetical protein